MWIKIHRATRYVVAICDSDLIDKKFFDNDGLRQIDLTGQFFKGEDKPEQEITDYLFDMKREDACFNIVGEKACKLAIAAKIVNRDEIITIANIPIAMILS
jgi:hypothetical protein